MNSFTKLQRLPDEQLKEFQELCGEYKRWMFQSNNYAPQRYELHIRRFVRLPKTRNDLPKVDLIANKLGGKYIKHFRNIDKFETIGDLLLPDFHQGILMYYPSGSYMKKHRDHWIYAKGAAQLNIEGDARLILGANLISLSSGDCIKFDNTIPHSVQAITERWTICFFKLKPKYLQSENQL